MFQIDTASRVPIYEQLKNSIVNLAAAGVLKPDDQLPPVRTMALELGINPNTVAKAYKQLEADGLTYSVVGKGSFISEKLCADSVKRENAMAEFSKLCARARDVGIEEKELRAELERVYEGGFEDDRDTKIDEAV